jgi:predicted CXXCH cytochrome family protein
MRRPDVKGRHIVALALFGLAVTGGTIGSIVLRADRTPQFPHEQHARLFPLCGGCHEGVETGDPAAFYPPPQLCVNCHNGEDLARVEWTGPRAYLTNLVFEHAHHQSQVQRVDGTQLECEQCHTPAGGQRMDIVRVQTEACFSCHAHRAADHFTDANCSSCHTSFVESELTPAHLPTLSMPEDHRLPGFLLEGHGPLAQANTFRCAVCHTQERCTSCHVNAPDVPEIAQVPAAPGGWTLPAYAVQYPVPPSHLSPQWIERHGAPASRAACATCHVRQDCTSCHVEPVPPVVETLPFRVSPLTTLQPANGGTSRGNGANGTYGGNGVNGAHPAAALLQAQIEQAGQQDPRSVTQAPGTGTQRRMPLSHASRWFQRDHAGVASSQPQNCAACHTRTFCTDCHDAPARPAYHPRNFALQHSAAAYAQRLECSTCHEVRTFCRACHVQQGMEAEGRLGPGFHDAEPLWLLRHARAARQGLESCTTCHTQRDCMQCHSQLGSFQISPHGPNFDARRAYSRNPVICSACHVGDPLNGRNGR